MDLATEREHLAKAERDVAEGHGRIAQQEALIAHLLRDGHDVTRAQELLGTLRETLEAWESHRESILRTISNMEAGVIRPEAEADPNP